MKHEHEDGKRQPTGASQKTKMTHQTEQKADKPMDETPMGPSKRQGSKPHSNDAKSGMNHNKQHK